MSFDKYFNVSFFLFFVFTNLFNQFTQNLNYQIVRFCFRKFQIN